MRHKVKNKKLGRHSSHTRAIIRHIVSECLRHGAVRTTKTRAKVCVKYVDKMIALALRNDFNAKKQVSSFVYYGEVVDGLFNDAPGRYPDKQGNYCRVRLLDGTGTGNERKFRRGDATEMAILEIP